MRRRSKRSRIALWSSIVVSASVMVSATLVGTSGAAGAHRPDAWIKLCGPTNVCLNQPWHPWHGDNVYSTGRGQKLLGGVEEGNFIRFWVLLENDGANADTLIVKGCSGNQAYPLRAVNVGAWRFYTKNASILRKFKRGTAAFSFPASTTPKTVIITMTFLAATSKRGVTYACPVTVRSKAQRTIKDTVVAKMITI